MWVVCVVVKEPKDFVEIILRRARREGGVRTTDLAVLTNRRPGIPLKKPEHHRDPKQLAGEIESRSPCEPRKEQTRRRKYGGS